MIYYDDIGHLISDTSLEELHTFAINRLGFKKEWYQDDIWAKHYDLTTSRAKKRAEQAGAIKINAREICKKLKEAPYNKHLFNVRQ